MLNSILVAFQFLTRLPVNVPETVTEEETSNAVLYYAVVGAAIGLVLMFTAWLTNNLDINVSAAILIIIWIVITGALHLDGLADTADAWLGGYGDKEKTLAIMKDPYCGPAGVVTLVGLLLFKFTLIVNLLDNEGWVALLLAPVAARFAASWLFHSTPYVREQGLGSSISNIDPGNHYHISMAVIAIAFLWALGFSAIATLALLVAVFYGLRDVMVKRIGGITGDTTGAMIEIMEVVVLFAFVLFID